MGDVKISLCEGKYVFVVNSYGLLQHAYRHGVPWPAGMQLGDTKVFMAALSRIDELEHMLAEKAR